MPRGLSATSASSRIARALDERGPGYVFSAQDFTEYGSRAAIDQALQRLVKRNTIRRIARGLYELPRFSRLVGMVPPEPDEVAAAAARRAGARIIASGSRAANELGISTQVPGRHVYITDGKSQTIRFQRGEIELRHATPKRVRAEGAAAHIIETLRLLGSKGIDEQLVQRLRNRLSSDDRESVRRALRFAPSWMQPHLKNIASDG